MKRFAIAVCLLLAGCEDSMTLDQQLEATKKCRAAGDWPAMSVNIWLRSYISCYPRQSD